jgi:hypothetical protein
VSEFFKNTATSPTENDAGSSGLKTRPIIFTLGDVIYMVHAEGMVSFLWNCGRWKWWSEARTAPGQSVFHTSCISSILPRTCLILSEEYPKRCTKGTIYMAYGVELGKLQAKMQNLDLSHCHRTQVADLKFDLLLSTPCHGGQTHIPSTSTI